jgi:microcin C transport system substrate-binding protein
MARNISEHAVLSGPIGKGTTRLMQRVVTTFLTIAALSTGGPGAALAAEAGEWVQATSLIESPRYPPDFPYFNYVNPDAPKGGTVRLSGAGQTFDTLNPFLSKGVIADGIGLIYESLLMRPLDELDIGAQYPQIAEALKFPPDFSQATYRLNPKAKWHDGEPITAEDVVWSFEKLIELNPSQGFYYQHVTKAEVTGEGEVTFTFDQTGNRELPTIVGELLILPKHWWEATDANGKQRDISATTLEPPLGSGPYKVAAVDPGRSITYERVPDFWGADLNTNVGQYNFDAIRYDYYRDINVEFEAFKADEIDFWSENEAKRWATGYDIPAVKDGRIKKETVNLEQVSGVMVGFIPNLRRPLFQDPRVRRALNYAFDFEELNRTIFFDQYERIDSFFYGLPMGQRGLPEGKELEILEGVRDQVPPEVFTEPYQNPVGGDRQKARDNLGKAVELFQEAGYRLEGTQMLDPSGKPVSFEILLNGPTIERVAVPYQQALKRIGIDVSVRSIDSGQFVNRVRSRDFDMIYGGWGQSNSPGNEQLDFWGSDAADRESSRNYGGIKDPAVDAIIKQIIFAKDRETQLAAVAALDRVMMWNQYVIPSYYILSDRIAYWNRFGHPDPFPKFDIGFPTVWWWDAAKAAEIKGAQ